MGRNSRMGEGGQEGETGERDRRMRKLEIEKCCWGEGLRGRGDNRGKGDPREGWLGKKDPEGRAPGAGGGEKRPRGRERRGGEGRRGKGRRSMCPEYSWGP